MAWVAQCYVHSWHEWLNNICTLAKSGSITFALLVKVAQWYMHSEHSLEYECLCAWIHCGTWLRFTVERVPCRTEAYGRMFRGSLFICSYVHCSSVYLFIVYMYISARLFRGSQRWVEAHGTVQCIKAYCNAMQKFTPLMLYMNSLCV